MASLIRIKRSSVSGNPTTLAAGELAYSALSDNGSNGGDRLYIGMGTESNGNAANHIVIGGKFFTDMLDHTKGVLTASSAIVVDADRKIDQLNIDNLTIDGNTISANNTNGNIILDPSGNGAVRVESPTTIALGSTAISVFEVVDSGGVGLFEVRQNGDAIIGGVLTVNGSGNSTFTGSVDIGGSLTVDGNASVNASLSGTDMTLTGNLVVNGNSTLGNEATDTVALIARVNSDIIPLTTSTYDLGTTSLKWAEVWADKSTAGNIEISGNTVSATNLNGDINITPNGTGKIVVSNLYIGNQSLEDYIQSEAGGSLIEGEGIDISFNSTTKETTISAEIATSTNLGVASFSSDNFAVTAGVVTIKDGGIANAELVNSSLTVGSTTISLGGTSTSIAGLTEITVDDLNINGNTITNQLVNGSISLAPNGTGSVDVSGKRITSVAEPTQATDAATKQYVDAVSEGLHIHAGVDAATPNSLAALTGGTVTYNNGSLGAGATLTLQNALTTLDGYTLVVGDRILVKNEATLAHNGIYVYTSGTVLTRAPDYDTDNEIAGGDFVFVVNGTLYNSTGWVQIDPVNIVGTDKIEWTQFSGAGTYLPGNGLSIAGNTFNVNLSATGGLQFSGSNAIELKSTTAGNGLTYSNGVLAVGGTANRITVNADTVDISSTYVGQTSITTVGTISTGTWQGNVVAPSYGGTGVNNGTNTITLGGNLTTSGAFATTLTVTGSTNVTLPTTGTLATLAGVESLSNKTISNSSFAGSVAATTLSASGLVSLTNATDATALGTAAVVLAGGISVAKQIRTGSNITGNGTTSTINGFIIDGGTY